MSSALNDLPIKNVNGATVYIKDVAQVRDGTVQTNIVRENGIRSAHHRVEKRERPTLAIVNRVKAALPKIRESLPPELKITPLFDQSLFVRAAIGEVVREGVLAAALTGMMILLFLGSWRSTLIVCLSIPLSIFSSLIVLALFGETINVMTLGGLALAVGILVDDATVTIENIHRNLAQRKPLVQAILTGAADRCPSVCFNSRYLYRVRAGSSADRRCSLFVYSARYGGGLCHACLLPVIAHVGPYVSVLPAAY